MMNQQKYQLALDYLIGKTGANQTLAQVNGDLYSNIKWADNTVTFSNDELISAYQITKKYQRVWEEFIAERNRRLAETDWWALGDRTMTEEQTVYRQLLRDLTDTAEPTTVNNQFDINSINWPVKPTRLI
jgi:hypothetical protein